MHPNQVLRLLRAWVNGDDITQPKVYFKALDEWLSEGGHPPDKWKKYGEVQYDDGYRKGQRDMWKEIKGNDK